MAIIAKRQAAIPPGEHRGIVIEAMETTTEFSPGKPEPTVRLTIQPDWEQDEKTETVPVSVNFSPVLNGISALSKLLERLGVPTPEAGKEFDIRTLEGIEVVFSAARNQRNFVQIEKDTIRRAPKQAVVKAK